MANSVPVSPNVFQKEMANIVTHFRRNSVLDALVKLELGIQARLFIKAFRDLPSLDRHLAEKRVDQVAVFLIGLIVERHRIVLVPIAKKNEQRDAAAGTRKKLISALLISVPKRTTN
ncbi:MAG: hypothetical protein ABI791_00935 [Acidobacteriota bacterium]